MGWCGGLLLFVDVGCWLYNGCMNSGLRRWLWCICIWSNLLVLLIFICIIWMSIRILCCGGCILLVCLVWLVVWWWWLWLVIGCGCWLWLFVVMGLCGLGIFFLRRIVWLCFGIWFIVWWVIGWCLRIFVLVRFCCSCWVCF